MITSQIILVAPFLSEPQNFRNAAQQIFRNHHTRARGGVPKNPKLRAIPPGEDPLANDSDVPDRPQTRDGRIRWLAEHLASGRYERGEVEQIAERWGLAPRTVENDIETASKVVAIATDDQAQLKQALCTRLANLETDPNVEPRDQIRAMELHAKVAGLLKGGTDAPTLSVGERNAQITESIRDPGDEMEGFLREALSNPTDRLRAILAEFTAIETDGVETGVDE